MKKGISLVMIVRNEEKVIARCLESVRGLVDEIIIVDTGSTDSTIDIAHTYGAKIYHFGWVNDFSQARNFALSKANYQYRFILDADEYVEFWDKKEMNLLLNKEFIGVLQRCDCYEYKGEIKKSKCYISRLLTSDAYYEGSIHEQVVSSVQRIKIPVTIGHDGYLYADKSERNLRILFSEIEKTPEDSYLLFQVAHTLFAAEKYEEAHLYYKRYFKVSKIDEVYRCGAVVDYVYNIINIGEFEEGLKIIVQEKERYSDSPDFNFACGHFYRELVLSNVEKYISYLPYIEDSFKKCLEIGETTKYDSVVGTGSYEAAYNLGAWYEVTGQLEEARKYYQMSSGLGYEKARERLSII